MNVGTINLLRNAYMWWKHITIPDIVLYRIFVSNLMVNYALECTVYMQIYVN